MPDTIEKTYESTLGTFEQNILKYSISSVQGRLPYPVSAARFSLLDKRLDEQLLVDFLQNEGEPSPASSLLSIVESEKFPRNREDQIERILGIYVNMLPTFWDVTPTDLNQSIYWNSRPQNPKLVRTGFGILDIPINAVINPIDYARDLTVGAIKAEFKRSGERPILLTPEMVSRVHELSIAIKLVAAIYGVSDKYTEMAEKMAQSYTETFLRQNDSSPKVILEAMQKTQKKIARMAYQPLWFENDVAGQFLISQVCDVATGPLAKAYLKNGTKSSPKQAAVLMSTVDSIHAVTRNGASEGPLLLWISSGTDANDPIAARGHLKKESKHRGLVSFAIRTYRKKVKNNRVPTAEEVLQSQVNGMASALEQIDKDLEGKTLEYADIVKFAQVVETDFLLFLDFNTIAELARAGDVNKIIVELQKSKPEILMALGVDETIRDTFQFNDRLLAREVNRLLSANILTLGDIPISLEGFVPLIAELQKNNQYELSSLEAVAESQNINLEVVFDKWIRFINRAEINLNAIDNEREREAARNLLLSLKIQMVNFCRERDESPKPKQETKAKTIVSIPTETSMVRVLKPGESDCVASASGESDSTAIESVQTNPGATIESGKAISPLRLRVIKELIKPILAKGPENTAERTDITYLLQTVFYTWPVADIEILYKQIIDQNREDPVGKNLLPLNEILLLLIDNAGRILKKGSSHKDEIVKIIVRISTEEYEKLAESIGPKPAIRNLGMISRNPSRQIQEVEFEETKQGESPRTRRRPSKELLVDSLIRFLHLIELLNITTADESTKKLYEKVTALVDLEIRQPNEVRFANIYIRNNYRSTGVLQKAVKYNVKRARDFSQSIKLAMTLAQEHHTEKLRALTPQIGITGQVQLQPDFSIARQIVADANQEFGPSFKRANIVSTTLHTLSREIEEEIRIYEGMPEILKKRYTEQIETLKLRLAEIEFSIADLRKFSTPFSLPAPQELVPTR